MFSIKILKRTKKENPKIHLWVVLYIDPCTIILWSLWTRITKRAIINRSAVMTKLRRDEMVALPILDRICDILNTDYGDIIEHVKKEGEKQNA